MAAPKKDVFADLFQSAAGTNRKLPADSSLKNLSSREPNAQNSTINGNWPNLDVLSPKVVSNGSQKLAPAAGIPVNDPFYVFDLRESLLTTLSKPPSKAPNLSKDSLLDEDFTDAFVSNSTSITEPKYVESTDAPASKRGQLRQIPGNLGSRQGDATDRVLAELVDIGFSVEESNEAIVHVGPELQNCVNYIMNKNSRWIQRPTQDNRVDHKTQRNSHEFNSAISDVSSKLYSTASWFLDLSKRKVITGISNLKQQRFNNTRDGTPAWMKCQEKYKGGVLEKREGEIYEDYVIDEDKVNRQEIQRIVEAQKQRESQRERIYHLNTKSSHSLQPSSLRLNSSNESQDLPKGLRGNSSIVNRGSESYVTKAMINTPLSTDSVDLLGLSESSSHSSAQRFKQNSRSIDDNFSIPTRRLTKVVSAPRLATNETLNAFLQSDYEVSKELGADAFSKGDFHSALEAYTKCLAAIPEKHELRIVITANLALTAIKLGNYRLAIDRCDEGMALVGESYTDSEWIINEKGIKYWYIRLLVRKAESMELSERFRDALECYMLLISKHNVTDLKILEAKRRVNKIVNPPKAAPKPKPKAEAASASRAAQSENVQRMKQQHEKEKQEEEMKFKLHNNIHKRTLEWSNGKETNLRALLMSLSEVLPQRLGFPFITDNVITMNDLMLTKKVKINYMRVISSIHPDKLENFGIEDRMICQLVFVTLNKAWDEFKVQNNVT